MASKPKSEKITVTAATSLFEDGATYQKGEAFETTPERARALGDAVTGAPDAKPETEG